SAYALIDGRWPTRMERIELRVIPPPPPPSPSPEMPWERIVWIAVTIVILVAGIIAWRSWTRSRATASALPTPRLSVRSGLGPTNVNIEHPERVRTGLTLRLRAGIRSVVTQEGSGNA